MKPKVVYIRKNNGYISYAKEYKFKVYLMTFWLSISLLMLPALIIILINFIQQCG